MVSQVVSPASTFYHFIAPSLPPDMISLIDVTSYSVTLLWQPPPTDSHNGIIRGYVVSILENDTGVLNLYNATDSTFTATGLHPYYNYEISTAAVTTHMGPFSSPISVQTDQAGNFIHF